MKNTPLSSSFLALALAGCGAAKDTNKAATVAGNDALMSDHMDMGGMAMGKHHEGAASMTLALAPAGAFTEGKAQSVILTLTDLASGKPMGPDDIALAHTKKLHLLIVDGSLSDYQHIHPRFGRTYKVWADVTRPDGAQEYVGTDLVAGVQPAPKPSAAVVTKAEMNGLTFSLSFSQALKVGQAAQGTIGITDSKTGQSFAGLQPIMGAFGHIVAFAGDWNSIEHVHPLGAEPKLESERGGPVIRFHIQPEQAGILKLFAQIKANGKETIVPFTLVVAR
jgi:hypothetical protein